ncbi:hypothetical protein SAMN04488132_10581 [Sediminibacterium ginsengisoli]|uniref:Transposase n=1 Tax=Sediminibacterium ginsengisoli TaxID=413434 RepID=A0A1T4NZV6_9BACT|nr:hypothetical protein SAMN04488132_10581 [Sediminibacterium ginsengisoli]
MMPPRKAMTNNHLQSRLKKNTYMNNLHNGLNASRNGILKYFRRPNT